MVAAKASMETLVELCFKYIPPDRLAAFAEELKLVDGNASVRETVQGVAKRIQARRKAA
jgi:hypothetical protein